MLIIEASFALSSQIHNYIPFLFNNKDTYTIVESMQTLFGYLAEI